MVTLHEPYMAHAGPSVQWVLCLVPSTLLLIPPFTLPSARSSQRKCSLGKPDQRELNENMAATQGLAHMIMECNRLFQVRHSLSPSKSSGHPGGRAAWSSSWAMSLPAQLLLCACDRWESCCCHQRETECHCKHSSVPPSIPSVLGLDSIRLGTA